MKDVWFCITCRTRLDELHHVLAHLAANVNHFVIKVLTSG